MAEAAPRAPLAVYMLADHLDAALAAGEDLIESGAGLRLLAEDEGDGARALALQRRLVQDVRTFELVIIARILKAREHAKALAEIDLRFSAVANLFASGTSALLDAVEECGDARPEDFDTGDDMIAYIRARGLIAPDAASVLHPAQWTIDDTFLIAKRVTLGPLLDMAAAFLDALDSQYELFADEIEEDEIDDDDVDEAAMPSARREFGRRDRPPVN